MNINILNGAFVDADPEFRVKYPHNLVPAPKETGVSSGYLHPADGIVEFASYPGVDRGGIEWNGLLYRVKGSSLVSIDASGIVAFIGDVGNNSKPVTMVYSFDYLAIASDEKLFLFDGTTLAQVTDADLGTVLDVAFIDGYFMTTDGEFMIVTELTDSFSVNPLKYGSSEIDPDPIVAVLELRNEIYVINTNTIEVFSNIGGTLFPFRRITGAQMERGAVSTHAVTVFVDVLAFVGNGRNEQLGVYLGMNGRTVKISTKEIDELLGEYTPDELASILVETRIDLQHELLYVHLPDITFVYDKAASKLLQTEVWFTVGSGTLERTQYRARGFVYVYNKWISGDPTSDKVGVFSETVGEHYTDIVKWSFSTQFVYNESKGAIFNELELVSLGGQIAAGKNPVIQLDWSDDGVTWSQPYPARVGTSGDRATRIRWFQVGAMAQKRVFRFSGSSTAHVTFARLEAQIEGLAW